MLMDDVMAPKMEPTHFFSFGPAWQPERLFQAMKFWSKHPSLLAVWLPCCQSRQGCMVSRAEERKGKKVGNQPLVSGSRLF